MDLGLQNRVVAITGGSTGIGRACALSYLEEGCLVAVCGRGQDKLDEFMDMCRQRGAQDRVLCHKADVADTAQLEAFLAAVVRRFGRVDIWLNNAARGIHKPLMEVSLEEWDALMNLNVRSVLYGSQLVAQQMIRQGQGGVIVNASSFTERMPVAGNGPYSVSKWGVACLTRVLAAELAGQGIRVFAYVPGMIRTPLTEARIAVREDSMTRQIALGRLGLPEDIAHVVVMLSSDRGSYVNGCSVEISGGKFCVQNPDFSRIASA